MKVAVIQHPPEYLNLPKSIKLGVELIQTAAKKGAKLIIFPEAWFPGYPEYVWRLKPGGQKTTLKKIYRRGNHFKANYPNEAFRKHNEAKMLAKLKYNVDQDVQDLMPEAIEIAKNKKRERLQEVQRSIMKPQKTTSPYVTTFNECNGGYGSTYYHSAHAHLHSPITFRNTPRQKLKPKKGPYEI